jgi:hypothetical protein
MITFSCPHCGTEVRAAPEDAGLLVPCDACGEAVPAPGAAITDAPTGRAPVELPSAVVRPTPARGPYEDVFYDDGKVLVCESQLIIGSRTYPLRHVESVEKFRGKDRIEHRKSPVLVASIVASGIFFTMAPTSCMLLGMFLDSVLCTVLAYLLMFLSPILGGAFCILLMRTKVPMYGIGLVEKGGYVEELLFRSRELRDDVFAALCEALDLRP